jgi:hypothetical protein
MSYIFRQKLDAVIRQAASAKSAYEALKASSGN